ncbi:MAG TPA: hypothetical protein VFA26_09620 [Gemmataceae bacterium]|nr:hypothetical protein [Gemmataceae bacterium]
MLAGWTEAASSTSNTDFGPASFALARYLPSAPQIGSFTASPNPATSGDGVILTAANITDGNPSATVTQVSFCYFDSNGNKVVLGTVTQSNNRAWSVTFTINLAPSSYTLCAQAEDSYSVFGDPFAFPFTVQ